MQEIGEIIKAVKEVNPAANVMVDNCYGEFTDVIEPTHVGADIIAGSLIKNPGGGIAPTGGYVAGRAELVERAAMRLTTPGIGGGTTVCCFRDYSWLRTSSRRRSRQRFSARG